MRLSYRLKFNSPVSWRHGRGFIHGHCYFGDQDLGLTTAYKAEGDVAYDPLVTVTVTTLGTVFRGLGISNTISFLGAENNFTHRNAMLTETSSGYPFGNVYKFKIMEARS